jgi:hypothetical protein
MPIMNKANRKTISFVLTELTPLPTGHPPLYADIHLLQNEPNSCTAAINSEESKFGYSFVSMSDEDYLHFTDGAPFNTLKNPGHQPIIPNGVATDIHPELINLN